MRVKGSQLKRKGSLRAYLKKGSEAFNLFILVKPIVKVKRTEIKMLKPEKKIFFFILFAAFAWQYAGAYFF